MIYPNERSEQTTAACYVNQLHANFVCCLQAF